MPFTLEAELRTLGSDSSVTTGTPSHISISKNSGGSSTGSSLRVAQFQTVFPKAGFCRSFARVRVGPGNANDDSLFIGAGFSVKDPPLKGDWKTVNNLFGIGFANAFEAMAPALNGTEGSGVWKWIYFSKLSGIGSFTVIASDLSQTFDIGGREDGFDIDKLVFAPATNTYTVTDLDTGGIGVMLGVWAGFDVFPAAMTEVEQAGDAHSGKAAAGLLHGWLGVEPLVFLGFYQVGGAAIHGHEGEATPLVLHDDAAG